MEVLILFVNAPNHTVHNYLHRIAEIVTVSPLGLTKSSLQQVPNTFDWMVTLSWTPEYSQIGPHIFCFSAIDNQG